MKKRIAFIPPSAKFVYQDGFFDRISYFFRNSLDIETSLIILKSDVINSANLLFDNVIIVENQNDLFMLLNKNKFNLIFHRAWMHRYQFAGELCKRFTNVIVYIKDWMDEIPKKKYKFLYETDSDYDGMRDILRNSKLVLSHYRLKYMKGIAKKYNVPKKKFIFFPEYCNPDKFIIRNEINYDMKKQKRVMWAGGISPSTAPMEISSDKDFFQDFRYISKKNLCFNIFILQRTYDHLFDKTNKLLWQDWLYENEFNKNLNIKLGTRKFYEQFENHDYALSSGFTYNKSDLSLINFSEAVVSKIALYLELAMPIIVHSHWKAIAQIVKKHKIGIIIDDKKNLSKDLDISKKEYLKLVKNIYVFRKKYTYNKNTMKPLLELLK